jgi:hypothetical protein
MWGNGASVCTDDRKTRTLPPIWRVFLPLPEQRW